MMIVVVMACNAISNNGARDGADGAANYTARGRAAHKSRLIGHSGTGQSKRRGRNAG